MRAESLLTPNADQRPIQRYDNQEQERIHNTHAEAQPEQILGREESVGISKNQNSRLVAEDFSATGERPDHAHGQSVQMMGGGIVHQNWDGSAQHREFAG